MTRDSASALVVCAEPIDGEAAAWLGARCRVETAGPGEAERFAELLREADGLIVRTYTRVDEALLAAAPRLRIVGRAGVGLDNIDLGECARRGVAVVHTPDANTSAVVELVLAFMLDALRPRVYLDTALETGRWNDLRKGLIAPRQLEGQTLGVLGLGRVGSALARAAAALGMRVIYTDLLDIPEQRRHGAEPVEVERLFGEADVLSIHVDERPSNRGLVGRDLLDRCKPDALVINTSRGFVVDAAALADWLRERPDAAAVLDVHEPEPFGEDYPLLGLANARLTPHIGAATHPAHRNMSWVVRDVWRVLSGERPRHAAHKP